MQKIANTPNTTVVTPVIPVPSKKKKLPTTQKLPATQNITSIAKNTAPVSVTAIPNQTTPTTKKAPAKVTAPATPAIEKEENKFIAWSKQHIFTRAMFFKLGVLACLFVSVVHGVYLFTSDETITIAGININILVSCTIDIGIWFLLDAMMYTKKRGLTVFSYIILIGIIVCCVYSFFANYTYWQQHYLASAFTHVAFMDKQIVTLFQSSPPLIVVFLSLVSEVFIKGEVNANEMFDFKSRLRKKYQQKTDKLEVRLEAQKREQEIIKQYNETMLIPPSPPVYVKFSLLGIKVYAPVHTPVDLKQIEDKMTQFNTSIVDMKKQVNVVAKFDSVVTQLEEKVKIALEREPQIITAHPVTAPSETDKLNAFLQSIKEG